MAITLRDGGLSAHPNPYMTQAFLDEQKAQLPGPLYAKYFENEWGASGLALFAGPDIEAMFEWSRPARWSNLLHNPRMPASIGSGLDRALPTADRDGSVWTTVARRMEAVEAPETSGDRQQEAYLSGRITLPPFGERRRILNIDKHFYMLLQEVMATGAEYEVMAAHNRSFGLFGYHRSILEVYQSADLHGRIQGSELGNPTSQKQHRLFSRMSRALRERRLHAEAEHKLLRKQLFEFQIDTSGPAPRYGTPGTGADDTVYSLAWAMDAADEAAVITGERVVAKPAGM